MADIQHVALPVSFLDLTNALSYIQQSMYFFTPQYKTLIQKYTIIIIYIILQLPCGSHKFLAHNIINYNYNTLLYYTIDNAKWYVLG